MIGVLRARMRRFAHRVMTRRRIDLPLAGGLFVLALIGLATLYSAGDHSFALVGGQAARFVLGVAFLLLVSRIPPSVLRSWSGAQGWAVHALEHSRFRGRRRPRRPHRPA
ncbi:hypothetical protein [Rhodanobacter lindaniclasticus]